MKKIAFFFLLFVYCFKIEAQIITTIAGNGLPDSTGNTGNGGQATAAGMLRPAGVCIDAKGNLYISTFPPGPTFKPHVVRKVNAAGIIGTIAGIDTAGFSGDGGPATAAKLNFPENIETDRYGNVYIADRGNRRVRKVDTFGIITTFAGNGSTTPSGDGGPATAAGMGSCYGVCCDTAGNIYIAAGNRIRKVNTSGTISTIAGTGTGLYSGDGGPATAAEMTAQGQIAFDKYGNLYVAEGGNNRVRKINTAGIITTIAGNGTNGSSGDGGMATLAQFGSPTGVFPDNCGNIYIVDGFDNRIRIVNGSGIVRTFAGIGGAAGHSGDGGPASAAKLSFPHGIYLDKNGNIYIADFGNLRVRYIHMDSCRNTTEVPVNTFAATGFTIFPNPATGTFMLNLSSPVDELAEGVVTNIVGEKVKEFTTATNKETVINLHAPPGVYFIQVSTASGKWVQKLLVE